MIILSQDKTNIFNFDNITQIFLGYIGECSINCETVKGEIEILGIYSSSERAKKILEELIVFYIRNENKNKVFRIPIE